jgi:hypothetical protein
MDRCFGGAVSTLRPGCHRPISRRRKPANPSQKLILYRLLVGVERLRRPLHRSAVDVLPTRARWDSSESSRCQLRQVGRYWPELLACSSRGRVSALRKSRRSIRRGGRSPEEDRPHAVERPREVGPQACRTPGSRDVEQRRLAGYVTHVTRVRQRARARVPHDRGHHPTTGTLPARRRDRGTPRTPGPGPSRGPDPGLRRTRPEAGEVTLRGHVQRDDTRGM